MAVDNKKLVYLIDPFWQGEGINGKPLVAGYMCVYHAGTNTPYITYQNFDGTRNPFKIPLNNDGRATILAEPYYKYDCYLYDSFGNLACSRLNVQPQVGGDVSVSGFTEVWHDDTLSGEGTPQSPLTVIGGGGSGKTYSGIDPIVVNNIEDKISANTVPFGVQEPLYFVEDETATVIGISGNPSADAVNWVTAQNYLQRPDLIGYATKDFVEEEVSSKYDTSAFSTISGAFLTAVPEGSMNESAFGYSGGLITSYNGSAFKAGDEFPQSATEAILVVTANSGKWNDTFTALTSKSAVWDTVTNKLDESAFSSVSGDFQTTAGMTAYQPAGDYLTTGDSSNFYTTANPSGFITGVDLTPYQTTAGMTAYASKDDVSGLQSASVWNDAVNTVSSNSASWTGIEYTGVSPIVVDNATRSISADTWSVTFGSGLSAIDDTANSATTIVVTAQGGGELPQSATEAIEAVTSNSGNWNSTYNTVSDNSASWATGANYSAGNNISISNKVISTTNNLKVDSITASGDVMVGNSGTSTYVTAADSNTSGSLWFNTQASLSDTYRITFGMLNETAVEFGIRDESDWGENYWVSNLSTASLRNNFTITGLSSVPGAVTSSAGSWTSLEDLISHGKIGVNTTQTSHYDCTLWQITGNLSASMSALNATVATNSAKWNTVTSKLDTSAFSTVSGNFLTAHQALPNSGNWNEAYTTVSTNSASWTASGPSYSAGNMISLANDTVSVSSQAGITDIVSATALPQNPVSTVLYLIPEA